MDSSESLKCLSRAKTIYPFEGKIYDQIASLNRKDEDYLSSVYYYLWALSCQLPFEAAKESLISLFEVLRKHYVQQEQQQKPAQQANFY